MQIISNFYVFIIVLSFVLVEKIEAKNKLRHKYYFSYSNIEYNPKNKHLEFILDVPWHDIEMVLRYQLDKPISIDDKDFEDAFKNLVQDNISISNTHSETLKILWVGIEFKSMNVSAYFEVAPKGKYQQICNELLLDLYPNQVNIMNWKDGKERKTFALNAKKTCFAIPPIQSP